MTEEQKQELLPSGAQPIYRDRAGWAHDRLKRAGLSISPRRGSWQITQAGREFLERHPQPLPAEGPHDGVISLDQQIENETEWLRQEKARGRQLLALIDALCFPPDSRPSSR